ncbi:MAG: WbqC family protein [Bacteroidetes bacterium]|nr:WbqC family protein [Bacteroidota bacterium]
MLYQSLQLATAAFPTLEYFYYLKNAQEVFIDATERFIKQSNRNRYHVLGANGISTLTIPVKHQDIFNTTTNKIEIDYHQPWQRQHWQTIRSAYNKSPFFEFMMDDFEKLFFSQPAFLLEYNQQFLEFVIKKNKFTTTWTDMKQGPETPDLSIISNAKSNKLVTDIELEKYLQVFGYKMDFVGNLSVLDYLFNCGNTLANYLT